jgi:hypothetical protein
MVLLLTCKFGVSFLGWETALKKMEVIEIGQSEMVNFEMNLNRREANNDASL